MLVASAGFMVHNADKKGLVQRLAVVDHMLTRFNKELGYQQSEMKRLQVMQLDSIADLCNMLSTDTDMSLTAKLSIECMQAQTSELQFYSTLHQNSTPQQA